MKLADGGGMHLLRAIDGYEGHPATRAAWQPLALTFVRPGELRRAYTHAAEYWDERVRMMQA